MAPGRGRRGEKKGRSEKKSVVNEFDADFIPLDADSSVLNYNESADPSTDTTVFSEGGSVRDNRASFFGLLDRAELEYFKNAESVLATNSLNADEREAFLDNLFDEAKGKELKLATNQVCSKLVERMIQLANSEQLQQLVSAFEPFAADLAFQKFSSHCLEAAILAAISIPEASDSIILLGQRLCEFSADLVVDRYASHVMSSLILGLCGLKESLRSKKSQMARKHTEIAAEDEAGLKTSSSVASIEVPASLRKYGCQLVTQIIESYDEVEARKLAIDPIGSHVAQALVMADASLMSQYSFAEKIVGNKSSFVSHCVSDPIGSHFLETVIRTFPAKKVSKLVDSLPLGKLATSENDASKYLAQAVIAHSNLPRRRKIELLEAELKPALGKHVGLSVAALDVDFETFAPIITERLSEENLNIQQSNCAELYERLAKFGPFEELAVDSVVAMDDKALIKMGTDPTQSYIMQSLLNAGAPLIARRKLLNRLVALVPEFALNAHGSHIVDSMWNACFKLKFARERIAGELLKLESGMKHSPYGRMVWKNWNMEKYLRKRNDWFTIVKQEEDSLRSKIEPQGGELTGIAKAAAKAAATPARPKKRKVE